MFPAEIEFFATEGEGRVYRFFAATARPDGDFLCWYTPDIQDREPDFVLFSKEHGLVIFEVKDWALDQIVEAEPQHFRITVGGRVENRANPLRQAREYFAGLMETLRRDGRLLSSDPAHRGKPKIPVHCAVVFANINKYEYRDRGLDRVIATERAFFWDDLHPASDVCYNIALVNYIRRLLADRQVPLGPDGVTVVHFYQLCAQILGETVPYENEDADYYDLVAV